jgi:hypothetical protein
MGVPTSEVGYTSATARRGDHEVRMNMWWHWRGGGVLLFRGVGWIALAIMTMFRAGRPEIRSSILGGQYVQTGTETLPTYSAMNTEDCFTVIREVRVYT